MNAKEARRTTEHALRNSDKYMKIMREINSAARAGKSQAIINIMDNDVFKLLSEEGYRIGHISHTEDWTISW